jgi:hypothetical protein
MKMIVVVVVVENIVQLGVVVVDMDDDVEHIDDLSTFVDNDLLNVHVVQELYLVMNELISTFLPNIVDNHFHNLRLNYSLYVLNFEYN